MKKLCIYFKEEVSGSLFDLGKYDGTCTRKKKDKLVLKKNCSGLKRCRSYADQLYQTPNTPF